MKLKCFQKNWSKILHSDILIDANLKVMMRLHLVNLVVLLHQTWSELQSTLHHHHHHHQFLDKVLNELITHSIFSTSHTLAMVVSKRKLICYNDKSLKLVHLLTKYRQ